MELALSVLTKIPDLDTLNLRYDMRDSRIISLIASQKEKFSFTGNLTMEFLQYVGSRSHSVVPVISSPELLAYLRKQVPDQHPCPNGKLPFSQVLDLSAEYGHMNDRSKKKRRLTVLQDIYVHEGGRDVKIVPYNSFIADKNVKGLQRHAAFPGEIDVLDSESGVLVFVPDVKDFKMKVDLFALLAGFDFPIYDSGSVDEAMQIYREKSPKMAILTSLDSMLESKELLLELEEYDPFIKKLNYTESPSTNREKETQRIRHHYFSGYKEMIETDKEEAAKDVLPEQIKNTILASIKELEKNFSKPAYYEKLYALKQFGRYFNTGIYWKMMQGLRSKLK
jgi:hypothetical protein